jgi:membrane-bound serine protease (ClpP class)
MAGDAAAMAPRTIIGAASPISGSGENLDSDARAKAVNDLKAVVRVNVERRGEEALALAESMVEEAVAVTANEASEIGLVDFIAEDTEELLQLLNGFSIQVRGEERVLNTEDIRVLPLEMSFIESLLLLLTNPNISFLLIAIGVQAVLIEISSPGGWVAGFIGVVCLTLAIYGIGVLPVNWFGIIFLILAFILFILEINAPTHGALTAAGVASFIVGALVLFNSPGTPDFLRVSVPLVIATGLGIGLLFFAVLLFAIRALRAPVSSGAESFAGKIGTVTGWGDTGGQVQLQSELWSADATGDSKRIRKGDKVEVVEVKGLRLKVRKIK